MFTVLHQRPTSQDGRTGEVFMTCISFLLLHTGYRVVAFFATPVLFQFLFLYVKEIISSKTWRLYDKRAS